MSNKEESAVSSDPVSPIETEKVEVEKEDNPDVEEVEYNFKSNVALDLYDDTVDLGRLQWFSPKFFEEAISLASADSTIHVVRIYLKTFSLYNMRAGIPLFTRSIAYPDRNRKEVCKSLVEYGLSLIGEHLDDHVFANNDMIVSVFDNGYMNAFSSAPGVNELLFQHINEHLHISEEVVNRAYVLEQTSGGYSFSPYKINKRDLIEENYMPSVVEQLPRLYTVVNSDEPFGRLAILEGSPGGGKTSLIRGMMNSFGRPKFVVIPPYLVANLSSPAMIASLIREQTNDPRPLVLVLEDADSCLTGRDRGNMSDISAILNLADGILSDTMDIRIVATTNAKRVHLDKALERNGRIGAYIQVPPLSLERASGVLFRLLEDDNRTPKELETVLTEYADLPRDEGGGFDIEAIILADVYAVAAHITGDFEAVRLPTSTKNAVGFA